MNWLDRHWALLAAGILVAFVGAAFTLVLAMDDPRWLFACVPLGLASICGFVYASPTTGVGPR